MIIKYVKKKEIEKSGYAFTQLVGEKADGSPYTKDFFANDEKLNGQLDEYAPGEYLNLSYNSDKYKNLKDIQGAEGFPEQRSSGGKKSSGTKTNEDTGTTRGMDTNRSAAMYLAKDIVTDFSKNDTGLSSLADTINTVLKTADYFLSYLLEGRNLIEEDKVKTGLEVPKLETEEE